MGPGRGSPPGLQKATFPFGPHKEGASRCSGVMDGRWSHQGALLRSLSHCGAGPQRRNWGHAPSVSGRAPVILCMDVHSSAVFSPLLCRCSCCSRVEVSSQSAVAWLREGCCPLLHLAAASRGRCRGDRPPAALPQCLPPTFLWSHCVGEGRRLPSLRADSASALCPEHCQHLADGLGCFMDHQSLCSPPPCSHTTRSCKGFSYIGCVCVCSATWLGSLVWLCGLGRVT